jgi:hypothetical protein
VLRPAGAFTVVAAVFHGDGSLGSHRSCIDVQSANGLTGLARSTLEGVTVAVRSPRHEVRECASDRVVSPAGPAPLGGGAA